MQEAGFPDIGDDAAKLLETAIVKSASMFQEAASSADSAVTEDLKQFIVHPAALDAPRWKALFGALPPRGTLARVARLLDDCQLLVGLLVFGPRMSSEMKPDG